MTLTAVLVLLVSLAYCCMSQDVGHCEFRSCKDLFKFNGHAANGEHWFSDGYGGRYRAYCHFSCNHGYMFIAKEGNNGTINFGHIGQSHSKVLVKVQGSNSVQRDTLLEQIDNKYPLSVQYNANVGYATPLNHQAMGSYIYLGFLPKSYAAKRNKQGYKANGRDFTFNNCDANPNSYLAFFFNQNHAAPSGYYKRCCYTNLMKDWINVATPATDYLPSRYFFQFEMHMGGCGGYAVNGYNTLNDIWGAAIGLYFDL